MIRSLYTSVSSLISLENRQSVITNNMANANTTGFKSDNLSIKSFDEVYIQNRDNANGKPEIIGSLSLGSEIDEVNTYFSQGLLKQTSKPTDFAIEGRGFFVIQKATLNGVENLYTRDGNFKIGTDGCLMTTSGDKVLGINQNTGNVEPIFVGNSNFILDSNNTINIDGFANYTLMTADFIDYDALTKVGDNCYKGENPITNGSVWVNQGYTEGSNVSLTNEMVNMMTTMRNFETIQKMVQIIDDTLSKAAYEIGKV